jgi:hypothetical protein
MDPASRWTIIAVSFSLAAGLVSAQTTVRVSVDSAGVEGNGASDRPSISADGRFVAFSSLATNLVAGSDTDSVDRARAMLSGKGRASSHSTTDHDTYAHNLVRFASAGAPIKRAVP